MRTTIDRAGRLVIPKALRDRVGLIGGEVELIPDGAGIRIEAVAGRGLADERHRLVIPAGGAAVDERTVRTLQDADRR